MKDLKADSVQFLTRREATELDRSAAKLFARCDVEVRHGDPGKEARPSVDVMIRGRPDTISEIKACDFAGRVENAVRQTGGPRVRYLQWVEERGTESPRSGSGIGDGPTGG